MTGLVGWPAAIPSPSTGVWQLGPIPVRAYALAIILGIVVAVVIADRRWVARGGTKGTIADVALWAVPAGIVGARLYHVFTDWSTYFGPDGLGLVAALKIWQGGLGIWGAVRGPSVRAVVTSTRRCGRTGVGRGAGNRAIGQLGQPGVVRRSQ